MFLSNDSYLIRICLHAVKWFQVFLSIINNIQTDLFDLTGTTTLGQNKTEIIVTPQSPEL